MAIADTITSMQNHTSNAYTMIGYGTDLTGINKNLENLSSTIFEAFIESLRDSTTLYTNLPKISGNGTQITLNDTANAPMRITLKASELSQDATPTPDSPQDIHTISGDNSVVVCGKNFARVDDTNISATGYTLTTIKGLITTTTTGTNNSIDLCKGIRTGVYLPNYANANDYHLTPANQETYKLSISNVTADITGTANQIIEIFTNQRQIQLYITPAGSLFGTTSFTLQENEYVKSIYMWTNGITTINKLQFNIQLEKGSTATTYEPYVSQTAPINLGNIEYCKIGNYEDEFILTSGKNKFSTDYKTSDTFTTYTKIDNNSFSFTCSSTWKGATFTIPCEKNTDYFINYDETTNVSGNQTYCIITGVQTSTSLMAKYKGYFESFNSGENTSITINIGNGNHSSVTSGTISNIQLEKGTSTSSYEPYGTNQWYLKKNIGKVVLDGSESWYTNASTFRFSGFNGKPFTTLEEDNPLAYSNYFKWQNGKSNVFVYGSMWYTLDGTQFAVQKEATVTQATLADFKTWLGTHNTTVYYALATPTYTQITGTLETQLNNIYKNMLSYKGTTNVSQINNDLPFVLGVSAIQDLE